MKVLHNCCVELSTDLGDCILVAIPREDAVTLIGASAYGSPCAALHPVSSAIGRLRAALIADYMEGD